MPIGCVRAAEAGTAGEINFGGLPLNDYPGGILQITMEETPQTPDGSFGKIEQYKSPVVNYVVLAALLIFPAVRRV